MNMQVIIEYVIFLLRNNVSESPNLRYLIFCAILYSYWLNPMSKKNIDKPRNNIVIHF